MAQVRAQGRVILEGMGEVLRRRGKAQNQYQQEQREHQKGAIAALPLYRPRTSVFPCVGLRPDGSARARLHSLTPRDSLKRLPSSLIDSPSLLPIRARSRPHSPA